MTAAQFLERIQTIIGSTVLDQRRENELTQLFDQIRDDLAQEISDWIEHKPPPPPL